MENEKLTKELYDSFSNGNLDRCLELADENVIVISQAFGMTFNGRNEFLNFMQGFKLAVPDMKLNYTNVICSGNKVAVEMTVTGTQTGPLQTPNGTLPASGHKIEQPVSEFLEWENGKFKRLVNYQDTGNLLKQMIADN